ncbi:hypothetical protein MUG84_07280 [Paenibacillus sp. KQZ6P-2]|uniref:Uncharacterized protein n=1 Tax=Paenibacillus mangrovi TaxID=2931978 RepID=A0A9X2B250_9BACL|nr:hypothetical protein [Paenibacillus mangrovi]MCJ8011550.1 hypothetical protein [Paenibacillus mangrovi]
MDFHAYWFTVEQSAENLFELLAAKRSYVGIELLDKIDGKIGVYRFEVDGN